MKILICGMSGSGKSTLAEPLAKLMNAIHIGENQVAAIYADDLIKRPGTFDTSKRLAYIADGVVWAGRVAIIDAVCTTTAEKEAIGADFVVWMDTLDHSNGRYTPPPRYDYHISKWFDDTHEHLVKVVQVWMERNYE